MPSAIEHLQKFLLDKAPESVHAPEGMLKHSYVVPTYEIQAGGDDQSTVPERSTVGHYLQMYDWDACLFSQGAHRIGRDKLTQDVVANFLDQMHDDGYVPRTLSPYRIWDAGDMCKPFMCQSLDLQEERTLELADVDLKKFEKYFEYFARMRRAQCGLYHWRNVLESGVDDNLALLAPMEAAKDENEDVSNFPDGELLAVDLNSYLVEEFRAYSELLARRGEDELSRKYAALSADLAEAIEQLLWNERLGIYCNRYPDSTRQVEFMSWTGLLPVLLGFAAPERAERVIRDVIMSENHFLRPTGLGSVAASEPLCNQSTRGLYGRVVVSNWQGPLWVLPNVLAARGLCRYDCSREAMTIAERVVTTMADDLISTGTLHENYNAETGQGMWAPKFMSWNFLALELIDLLQ